MSMSKAMEDNVMDVSNIQAIQCCCEEFHTKMSSISASPDRIEMKGLVLLLARLGENNLPLRNVLVQDFVKHSETNQISICRDICGTVQYIVTRVQLVSDRCAELAIAFGLNNSSDDSITSSQGMPKQKPVFLVKSKKKPGDPLQMKIRIPTAKEPTIVAEDLLSLLSCSQSIASLCYLIRAFLNLLYENCSNLFTRVVSSNRLIETEVAAYNAQMESDFIDTFKYLYENLVPVLHSCIAVADKSVASEPLKSTWQSQRQQIIANNSLSKKLLITEFSRMICYYLYSDTRNCFAVPLNITSKLSAQRRFDWSSKIIAATSHDYSYDQLLRESCVIRSDFCGALFADTARMIQGEFAAFMSILFGEGSDTVKYYTDALLANKGFLVQQQMTAGHHSTTTTTTTSSSSSSSNAANSNTSSAAEPDLQTKIQEIKNIFPDYGNAFVAACLEAFDGSTERTVDALLSNNLPPKLMNADRTIQDVWIGKGGATRGKVVGTTGRSETVKYELQKDEALAKASKDRIKREERERERDFMLMQSQYNDDVDDEFEGTAFSPDIIDEDVEDKPEAAPAPVKGKGKRGKAPEPRINWEVKMAEVKRVNNMIMAEEAEQKYWADNRNTNRESGKKAGSHWIANEVRIEEEEDDPTAAVTSAAVASSNLGRIHAVGDSRLNQQARTAAQPATKEGTGKAHTAKDKGNDKGADKKTSGENSGGKGDGNEKPKYRTKTHDKHHQRDRATRKLAIASGGFN